MSVRTKQGIRSRDQTVLVFPGSLSVTRHDILDAEGVLFFHLLELQGEEEEVLNEAN